MKGEKKVHPVDIYVGSRLRLLRKKHNLSQTRLAEMIGVSHQQIQQYELGVNRIAASTLFDFSKILNVQVTYFYDGMDLKQHNLSSINYTKSICTDRKRALNILLIEDDPADELLTKEAIRACNEITNVYALHDGIEALEFLRNKKHTNSFPRPDIIILDLNIPKKNGHSVLKDIKRDREVQDIPVIMLTNCIDPQEMVSVYRGYASGYIVKSFDIDEFNDIFAKVIAYWSSIVLPSMQYDYGDEDLEI